MTSAEWDDFLEWLYKTHSITKDYKPNRVSIELWEEYCEAKQDKKKRKTNTKGSKPSLSKE